MQCESGANSDYYGPSVAQGSGAACGQTQPAISNQKSCDPSPKSVGGCTATPRQSYNEMAESQIRRMSGDATEVITRELIRAREIGQREGWEDALLRNQELEKTVQRLVTEALQASERTQREEQRLRAEIWERHKQVEALKIQFDAAISLAAILL